MKDYEFSSGMSFDLEDPLATRFLGERSIKIRDAYGIKFDPKHIQHLSNKINIILTNGYYEGRSISQIAERLKNGLADFVDITFDQALTISSTEIIGAASYSKYIRIKNSGYTKKKWITARDENVRPLHREMEGNIINICDLWAFSDGNSLRYPGDHEGPDHLVVNCRCVEVIVFESHENFMNDA